MPVKNPSAALLEAIRRDGVCRESGVTAQWGYHVSKEAKIFLLEQGEELPKGWSDTPVAVAIGDGADA